MKRILTNTALSLTMALCLASPAALASQKTATAPKPAQAKMKASPEHKAAVKKCDEEYKAAIKESKTRKGKERKDAVAAAKNAHKECLKNAPR